MTQALPKLRTLSEEVARLDIPQQSDKFVDQLRHQVYLGHITATYCGSQTFELPKEYRVRGGGTRTRHSREMLIEDNQAYRAWFKRIREELGNVRQRRPRVHVSTQSILSGEVPFAEQARHTQELIARRKNSGKRLQRGRTSHVPEQDAEYSE